MTINAIGHKTEYVYDGLGRRVQIIEKDIAQDQTETTTSDKKYLWVGTQIAEERAGTDGGTVTKRFFSQGFVDNDGTILLYTRDHLGSIRELVDMQQNVRARYDYDPYGNVTKISGDRDSQFLYTGHYWHAQSHLYLTLYRAYDPVLGRWISRDPIGIRGGLNPYAYVYNNPLFYLDSDGRIPLPFITAGIGALIGGGVELFNQYTSGKPIDWGKVAGATVGGAVSGFVAGFGGGFVMGMVAGFAGGVAGEAFNQMVQDMWNMNDPCYSGLSEDERLDRMALAGAAGAAFSGLFNAAKPNGLNLSNAVEDAGLSMTPGTWDTMSNSVTTNNVLQNTGSSFGSSWAGGFFF